MQGASLSDGEYGNLYASLQSSANHSCTRHCTFKAVFGNMFYCVTSGQAHVCDRNCTQRIALDRHTEICRLSRRQFPRQADPMSEAAPRKRCGQESQEEQQQPAKRMQPAECALQPSHAWPQAQPASQHNNAAWQVPPALPNAWPAA